MLSVHTSPLDQPGTGDAGGMNVYVLELSRALAARGARVEIFTRATSSDLPETVVLGGTDAAGAPLSRADRRAVLLADDVPAGVTPPVLVHHVPAGPFELSHRSLQAGLRDWVEAQTHHPLGYVEQLYTFADGDSSDESGGRVISVSYLGLTREAGVSYLNYNGDRRSAFNDDPGNFVDWIHLNRRGTEAFSRRLRRDLDALGVTSGAARL